MSKSHWDLEVASHQHAPHDPPRGRQTSGRSLGDDAQEPVQLRLAHQDLWQQAPATHELAAGVDVAHGRGLRATEAEAERLPSQKTEPKQL